MDNKRLDADEALLIDKCDCSEDDNCGCSYPNNVDGMDCECTKENEKKENNKK